MPLDESRDAARLSALAALELSYNGPVPVPMREAARYGSGGLALLVAARGEAAFFRGMVRGQIRALRRRRADGSFYPALLDDFALYRRHCRAWHHLALTLAAALRVPAAAHETERPRSVKNGASE